MGMKFSMELLLVFESNLCCCFFFPVVGNWRLLKPVLWVAQGCHHLEVAKVLLVQQRNYEFLWICSTVKCSRDSTNVLHVPLPNVKLLHHIFVYCNGWNHKVYLTNVSWAAVFSVRETTFSCTGDMSESKLGQACVCKALAKIVSKSQCILITGISKRESLFHCWSTFKE